MPGAATAGMKDAKLQSRQFQSQSQSQVQAAGLRSKLQFSPEENLTHSRPPPSPAERPELLPSLPSVLLNEGTVQKDYGVQSQQAAF